MNKRVVGAIAALFLATGVAGAHTPRRLLWTKPSVVEQASADVKGFGAFR